MATVYLAYTKNETLGWVPELLRIYKKSSYQTAYNWLAEIAERHSFNAGNSDGTREVFVTHGDGKIAAQVINPRNGQVWWLERWETE